MKIGQALALVHELATSLHENLTDGDGEDRTLRKEALDQVEDLIVNHYGYS